MTETSQQPTDGYLITKRGLYYRPGAMGYTGLRDNAGRYTLAEAQDHADPLSGVSYVHESQAPEVSPKCFDDVARDHLMAKLTEARARCTALHKALTPSAETKAAYIGEVKFTVATGFDDEGCEIWQDITVPWTTTKDIMAMILGHAALLDHPKYAPALQPGSAD